MTMQPLHKFLVVSQQSWNATQEVQFRPSVLLRLSVGNHLQLRVGLAMPDYGREAALFFIKKCDLTLLQADLQLIFIIIIIIIIKIVIIIIVIISLINIVINTLSPLSLSSTLLLQYSSSFSSPLLPTLFSLISDLRLKGQHHP